MTLLQINLHLVLHCLDLEFVAFSLGNGAFNRPLIYHFSLKSSELLLSKWSGWLSLQFLAINCWQSGPLLCIDQSQFVKLGPQRFIIARHDTEGTYTWTRVDSLDVPEVETILLLPASEVHRLFFDPFLTNILVHWWREHFLGCTDFFRVHFTNGWISCVVVFK